MNVNESSLCSLCCLSYNHSLYIQECIESLWNQKYKNLEIIAVDDGSNDNSPEILKELQKKSPFPMTVITQSNTGNIGKNLNRAIKKAKGEFISFTSMDDKLCENAISSKVGLMEKDDKLAFIANSTIRRIGQNNFFNRSDCLGYEILPYLNVDKLLNLEYENFHSFYVQGSVFRKIIIDRIGGFDEDIFGDDIVLRTKILRYIKENPELKFKINEGYSCYYRDHNDNIHKNTYRQFLTVVQYLDRYWTHHKNPELLYRWAVTAFLHNDLKTKVKIMKIKRIKNIKLFIFIIKKIIKK